MFPDDSTQDLTEQKGSRDEYISRKRLEKRKKKGSKMKGKLDSGDEEKDRE